MNDIEKIISQLVQQKAAIEKAIIALREVSGLAADESKTAGAGKPKTKRPKRHISPEGRKRIAEATRKRWAAKRAAEKAAAKVPSSAKRTRPVRKKAA
jgi:hypothetical protein